MKLLARLICTVLEIVCELSGDWNGCKLLNNGVYSKLALFGWER